MRVAVVIGSSYEKNGQLAALPSAALDCDLMERRLSDKDAGFRVMRFDAARGLAENLEQRLLSEREAIDDLLVYFTGYCVVSEERGPGLLLDGDRLGTFSLPRLRKVLEYFARRSCLIVDAAAVIEGRRVPSDVVNAFAEALTHDATSISMLVAARRSDEPDSFGGSAFTGLLLLALDWLASSREPDQAVDMRWLFDAIRADVNLFSGIPAAGLFSGSQSFELLPAPSAAGELPRFESEPEDAEDRTPTPPRGTDLSGFLPAFASPAARASADAVYDALFGVEHSAHAPLPSFADFPDAVPARIAEPAIREVPSEPLQRFESAEDGLGSEDSLGPQESARLPDTGAVEPEEALLACAGDARLDPTAAETYRRALRAFEALGDTDGAWNAASVLDVLGEADINEALLASQHKPEGLLAARGTLSYAEWQTALLADHADPKVWDVLEALGVAGVRAGAGYARHKQTYGELDPSHLQDPEKSTTMLAKTLGWTARLLGLDPPALYVVPELGARLEVATVEEPSTLAGRDLASGLDLGQLTFLWGRQLPRFRNELRALAFFRTPAELSALLTAALALGEAPGVSVRSLEGDTKRVFAALRRDVRGPAFDRLRGVARDFPGSDVTDRSARMLRGLELVGVRAGLVACGDVAAAAELLRRYPSGELTSADEQLGELFAFAISQAYAGVRRRIGVAIAA